MGYNEDSNSTERKWMKLKKQYELYLELIAIIKKATPSEKRRREIEKTENKFKEEIKECEAVIELNRKGVLREATALKYSLFFLQNNSVKLKGILEVQKRVLAHYEEVEKKVKGKKRKEVKKDKKETKGFIAVIERNLARALENEADPE
ncbi:hypothetical protein LCGC14_1297010 [marine sediment metagenome]|uniref:Uncharacterized protein n=1 Tax=marine sediment metagenome TaxID=412755 RepID=A0A0F9LBE0_9ZZZZ|nr:MAG: hypothetical protein Lokiarch_16510 [Candidatus Lokiarchaeum sp. GC14_75]HEA70494.1 hypothetical protein [archaeon]